MDEYQEYLRLFGDLPFGMRPKFEDYQKQKASQAARTTLAEGLKSGDYNKAYTEGFEKLPLMDQLLYSVAPGTGEALAAYEIPEFAERGSKAAEEGRYLDAAGNYAISGLNLLSMVPVIGKGAELVTTGAKAIPAYKQFKPAVVEAFETGDIRTTGRGRSNFPPAKFTIEDSILNNKKFQKTYPNPDKPYQTKNMLELMRRYGSPSGLNTNVSEQIDKYISKELKNKDKVTVNEIIEDIDKNKPTFTVNRATYPGGVEQYQNAPRETGYLFNTPFIPKYKNPRDVKEALTRKTPIQFDHKSFTYNPSANEDIYSLDNIVHREVSQGYMVTPPETRNRIFHTRQYTYDIDGQRVMVVAEGQSGAYKLHDKAENVQIDFTDKTARAFENSVIRARHQNIDNPISQALVDAGLRTDNSSIAYMLTMPEATQELSVNFKQKGFDFDNLKNTRLKEISKLTDSQIDKDLVDMINSDLAYAEGLNTIAFLEGGSGISTADITPNIRSAYREWLQGHNNLDIDILQKTADEGVVTLATRNNFDLKGQELNQKLQETLTQDLQKLQLEDFDPNKLPLFKQWFNVHMKSSLQDAVNTKVDEVWFPINAEALARQRGEELISPRAKELVDPRDADAVVLFEDMRTTPTRGAMEMAHKYKERTKKGLNAIEQDYGIKLQTETFMDDDGQEFIKVIMTPELKEALSTLRLNRGGLVSLMPLRY